MTPFTRHDFGLYAASQTLVGTTAGTQDFVPGDDLPRLAAWLRWRVTEVWEDVHGSAADVRYQVAVRTLALRALDVYDARTESTLTAA